MLLIMTVLNQQQNSFFNIAMAQGYDNYSDSYYSQYPTDDNKYECRTGPLEGFFVSSVEFCKQVKFDNDDKDRKDHNRDTKTGPQGPAGPPGPQGPAGSGNNNSTLVNTFNCINTNNININTDNNSSSSSSSSGLQPIQDAIAQGLNGTLDGLSLNKTIINLCVIYDNDSIVIEDAGNVTDGNATEPSACERCFTDNLTPEQIDAVIEFTDEEFQTNPITTIEELCNILENGENDSQEKNTLTSLLFERAMVPVTNLENAELCLSDLGLIVGPG
jgi:hypothetical protein